MALKIIKSRAVNTHDLTESGLTLQEFMEHMPDFKKIESITKLEDRDAYFVEYEAKQKGVVLRKKG